MKILKLLKKQERGYHTKKVGQYKGGVLIKKYKSLSEIQRKKGYLKSHISECCNKKRSTAYGYQWKYINGKE